MKFSGKGLDGYDPAKKKFVAVWVDSMSTAPLHLEGTYDSGKKAYTMTGEGPGLDGKPAQYKMVTTVKDKDNHTFMMYIVAGGNDSEMMRIDYARRK